MSPETQNSFRPFPLRCFSFLPFTYAVVHRTYNTVILRLVGSFSQGTQPKSSLSSREGFPEPSLSVNPLSRRQRWLRLKSLPALQCR